MAEHTRDDAEEEARPIVDAVVKQYHPELNEIGVTIELLFAHAIRDERTGEPKGPALKYHGYPALAVFKVNSQRDRVAGLADCRITFDADRWGDLDDRERRALVAHELYHAEIMIDPDSSEGAPLLDACNRPKIKVRQHDFEIGAFTTIIQRFGGAAPEKAAMKDAIRQCEALTFGWAGDDGEEARAEEAAA
jgi:hypothetical protein